MIVSKVGNKELNRDTAPIIGKSVTKLTDVSLSSLAGYNIGDGTTTATGESGYLEKGYNDECFFKELIDGFSIVHFHTLKD